MDTETTAITPHIDNVLMAPLFERIESKHGKRKSEFLKVFARRFFTSSSPVELAKQPLTLLYKEVMAAWRFIRVRKQLGPMIQFSHPENTRGTETVIHILSGDMPFLVDSISQELTQRGVNIDAVYNAVYYIGRSVEDGGKTGKLSHLSAVKQDTNHAEALLCFHSNLLSDKECDELEKALLNVLKHVGSAVQDFAAMCAMALSIRESILKNFAPVSDEEKKESGDFIEWLVDKHFTFLGYEQYRITDTKAGKRLSLQKNSLLGISKLKTGLKSSVLLKNVAGGTGKLILKRRICSFAKSTQRSKVHRPAYCDYVLIKEFDKKGNVRVEHRFIGLYTSAVYFQGALDIPLVRKKVSRVLSRSGFSLNGHSIKTLSQIINVFPRDELFQVTTRQLFDTAMEITHIHERRKVRMFIRKDSYSRLFSCLVYLPKDIYNTRVRTEIQNFLTRELRAVELDFNAYYSESILARLHFILRVPEIEKVSFDAEDLERRLIALVKPWEDELWDLLQESSPEQFTRFSFNEFVKIFPIAYKEDYSAAKSLADIPHLQKVMDNRGMSLEFKASCQGTECQFGFKIFRHGAQLVLSDVIPVLENMGLKVLSERGFRFAVGEEDEIWLHDFNLCNKGPLTVDPLGARKNFEEAFVAIWEHKTEDDTFNALVLGSELRWRQVALLRAYAAYMKQIQVGYGQRFIAETLRVNGSLAARLVEYFELLFDPVHSAGVLSARARQSKVANMERRLLKSIDNVSNLAQDNILRLYLKLLNATLRTNYFQQNAEGHEKEYFSFKIHSAAVEEIPRPRPFYEIFVYSSELEGVHLRGGKVARGGLRWSDRKEDYRTEVLGLVKAQQVKNAVIIPVGAKGGFVVKKPEAGLTRDALLENGIHCYKLFISGLLDLTDNIVAGKVVHPKQVLRRDEEDTYLVVAADKGTAAFSDIANGIAQQYGFWLGDGFASGGSNGYDHKKMGITARGAWLSVQSHFREMDVNIQKQDFTVVGIGDMSGDVFGNGMLLSPHIRLLAAFNHQHIFVDPDPQPKVSFTERRRLFKLPRSSWSDYNTALISKGGGVFSRSAKSINISNEMKQCFAIEVDKLSPDKFIAALLKSPVDLLWNGGIGTYVKGSKQSHAEIGDKANDNLRVDGKELRCKVIGEGGNLGLTQSGRVEFGLQGGISLTDFIDNSAGVDCSDHEVNIKILLNELQAGGKLDARATSALLSSMTDEVADLVLYNNYCQVQVIGLEQSQMRNRAAEFVDLLAFLESHAGLDRKLEHFPDAEQLKERVVKGQGLTRPELAVMTSYMKMMLKSQLVNVPYIADVYLLPYLYSAFPAGLLKKYSKQVQQHRLRNEIIATQLANGIVNLVGPSFIFRKVEYTGASPADVVKAAVIAKDVFAIDDCWVQIEALDYKVPAKIQQEMMLQLNRLMRRVTRWLLRNRRGRLDFSTTVAEFSPSIAAALDVLPETLPPALYEHWSKSVSRYTSNSVPRSLAQQLAGFEFSYPLLAVTEISNSGMATPKIALETYFDLGAALRLATLRQMLITLKVDNHWQALARKAFQDDLDWQQRALTLNVLGSTSKKKQHPQQAVAEWLERHHAKTLRFQFMLKELQRDAGGNYSMFSVALRELLNLTQSTTRY